MKERRVLYFTLWGGASCTKFPSTQTCC